MNSSLEMAAAWTDPCSFDDINPRSRSPSMERREFLEGNGRRREEKEGK